MIWLISAELRAVMLAHAAEAHPDEACGLLLGAERRGTEARRAKNVAACPQRHFEIDPAALLAAQRAARSGGPALIGYYHSHPRGAAAPSTRDAEMAVPDGSLWLILASGDIRGYVARNEDVGGRFVPAALRWV